jgi:hypothetical protein
LGKWAGETDTPDGNGFAGRRKSADTAADNATKKESLHLCRRIILVYASMMAVDPLSLPFWLQRGTAFVIFTAAVFMIAAHTAIAAMAAQRPSSKTRIAVPFVVAGFLAAWLAIAIVVGDGANFPISLESRRPLSGLVALIPFLIAVIALFASRAMRAINAATPSAWLIGIQTYRVAGIMFVFPFLTYGIIPAGFAWPAGVGDALTGILAPVVALLVARNRPHAWQWAVAWNLFGTLDLIVAPATALYFQAQVLGIYPISLVPLFLGPPLGILTHILSLRNLAVAKTLRPDTIIRQYE